MVRNSYVFLILCMVWWIAAVIINAGWSEEVLLRTINGRHSEAMDVFMQILTRGGEAQFFIPLIIGALLIFKGKTFNLPLISAIVLAIALPSILTNLLKSYFELPRPLTVFEGEDWLYIVPGYKNNYYASFPSGHTTAAFAFFAVMSYISGRRPMLYPVLFFLLAAGVGISRLYLLQHFWSDIFWGSIIGTVLSSVILLFYHRRFEGKKDSRRGSQPEDQTTTSGQ